jgi:Protein of unknown function with HXXEE motif
MGGAFVAAAVLFQALLLGLPAIFLSVALLISYGLWLAGAWRVRRGLGLACWVGILVFFAHAAEEFTTGFQRSLPALFERLAWTDGQYLLFNGVWALLFITAALAVRPGRPLPVLVILFLAIGGGVGNGLAHLLLAVERGAYFPGLWTAPLCLAVGIWLLRLLYASPPAGAV